MMLRGCIGGWCVRAKEAKGVKVGDVGAVANAVWVQTMMLRGCSGECCVRAEQADGAGAGESHGGGGRRGEGCEGLVVVLLPFLRQCSSGQQR